jgi:hypothetical protein
MTDPAPFLSTIAASSAGMVAIIGGLLVARFVTLDSEQQGAQQLLDDAQSRLATAQSRADEASRRLHSRYVYDFFETKVIAAVGNGTNSARELMKIGPGTRLTDEEIREVVTELNKEFAVARVTLPKLIPERSKDDAYEEWEDFRNRITGLPETGWDMVWEVVYYELRYPPKPQSGSHSLLGGTPLSVFAGLRAPEYVSLEIQQEDALRAAVDRAKQQLEDIGAEAAHLQRARDAVVRPQGLGWGLLVLAAFTLVGVIIPLWIMSRAPKNLSPTLGETVFWMFAAGLLLLLGYMTRLALKLSRGKR